MCLANLFFMCFKQNMNIQNNNRLNFKSNIHFVSSPNFDKQKFRSYFYCNSKKPLMESMLKGGDIWTPNIRTCSAGGLVDNDGALGFHFFNSLETIQKVKEDLISIVKKQNCKTKSALLIGGKRITNDSVQLFSTVLDKLKDVVKPSYFKIYKSIYAESDIGYDKHTDSWFINFTNPQDDKNFFIRKDVLTLEDLKKSFEEIKIAPQDKLFINGKEVTHNDAPEFFD